MGSLQSTRQVTCVQYHPRAEWPSHKCTHRAPVVPRTHAARSPLAGCANSTLMLRWFRGKLACALCWRVQSACISVTVASRAAIVFPSLESRRRRTCARVMDAPECLRRGAVGALGAVPGTLAAHPFDLLKMHQQVRAATLSEAIRHVSAGKQGPELAAAFYRGAGAGVAHARADVPLE